MFEIIVIIIVGFITGVIINLLADELPYRRGFQFPPVYPDGSERPPIAWSGILAFISGNRHPENPQPPPENIPTVDEDGNELSPLAQVRALAGSRIRLYRETPSLSWRYPLTEIVTIVLMLIVYAVSLEQQIPPLQTAFWLIYSAIFVLITVIDLEYKLILFVVTLPAMALALLDALLIPAPPPDIVSALLGGLLGFVVFFIFYQGGYLFTYIMGRARGEEINTVAFGYGDVMMITFSGLILGPADTFLAIFITVFLGAIGAIGYIAIRSLSRSPYSLYSAIPYGPYIVLATIIMMLFSNEIRSLIFAG